MKLLRSFAPLLVVALAAAVAAGCSTQGTARTTPGAAEVPAKPVQVEVEGTPGVPFEGTLGEPPEAKPIRGQVPARFTLEMHQTVFVRVQKAAQEGTLSVRVFVNGAEVASGTTTKPFGLVALSYPTRPRAR